MEPASHILPVEGHNESTSFEWNTEILMDLENVVSSEENITVLSFYCGEKTLSENLSPSLVLQSFVQNLVPQNEAAFKANRYCRHCH